VAGTTSIVEWANWAKRNRVAAVASGTPRCASVPVLIDFWAPWCGPCRAASPAVEGLGRKLAGRLEVVKVNIDQAPAVAARHDALNIPLPLLLQVGNEVDCAIGAMPATQLPSRLESQLTATTQTSST
jgi:thioredoxin